MNPIIPIPYKTWLRIPCAALSLLGFACMPLIHANVAEEVSGANGNLNNTDPSPLPTSSRFVGENIESYIQFRLGKLSMNNRSTDPFQLLQDPNAKPAPKPAAANTPVKRLAALPPTPLSEIVKLIRVTTIMPREKKFLVGTREFSQSDEIPVVYQGKALRLKIEQVSSSKILFRNLDNDETATLSTGMLPPGMAPGKASIRPAGMISPVGEQPLELGTPAVNSFGN